MNMETTKTQISFEDIKAGDLIEAVNTLYGVRYTQLGVAFEKVKTAQGDYAWLTSQGGTVTVEDDEDIIFRVEVK